MSKSVLSRGLAMRAARVAALAIDSSSSGPPTSDLAASAARSGRHATEPTTMRASRTMSFEDNSRAAATDKTGKSKEPRRRSFQYVLFQPSQESRSTSGSPARETKRTRAPRAINAGAVSEEETARHFLLPGATQQMSPSFFRQNPMDFRHS